MDAHSALLELQRIGLGRVLQVCLRHYQSYGTLGKPRVELAPQEEELLQGLTGKNHLDMKILDRALRHLKYQVSLPEVLEALHGGPIYTQRKKKQLHQENIQSLLDQLEHQEWIELLQKGQAGAHLLKTLLDTASDPLFILRQCEAILQEGSTDRRPVLATRHFGHAHALDSNQIAGKLLDAALRDLGLPEVQRDGVSSTALVAHLKSPELAEAYALPWRTVVRLTEVKAHQDRVYVVENPAVFEALLDGVASPRTLVCTSGQPSHALMALLERFPRHTTFLVNTDFDVGGLRIAHRLKEHFPEQFRSWRFDADHLQWAIKNHKGFHLPPENLSRRGWAFPELLQAMQDHRMGLHQEVLIPLLLQDLQEVDRSL